MIPGEVLLRRERLIAVICLAAITVAAWIYLLRSSATMPGMDSAMNMDMAGMDMSGMDMSGMDMKGMMMPETRAWDATAVFLLFVMWTVMMVAMMTPSAAPMILVFLSLYRRRQAKGSSLLPVGAFVFGYLVVWTVYSAMATAAQWALHRTALLSADMTAASPYLGGGLLLAAGVFQWSPLKRACLNGCRSPLAFLMSEWREGTQGALVMGLRHGAYCVGCCWMLMALLFVGGVMNLLWVAVLAGFVIAEKILPRGEWIARAAGIALAAGGIAVMARLW